MMTAMGGCAALAASFSSSAAATQYVSPLSMPSVSAGLSRRSFAPRSASRSDAASKSSSSDDDDSRASTPRVEYKRLQGVDRRAILTTGAIAAIQFALASRDNALADVKIALSNVKASSIPCPAGQTTVGGRTSFGAACYRVTGDASNPLKQPVYNADIFGRVYDAHGEPALDAAENLRIDTVPEIPPGSSKISFRITVNESQAKLGPLELKSFKATGYLGKVNNLQGTGRFDDIDFSDLDSDD